ncbi:ATP-binding SpoIIE family protein phosphatase [Streptomyces ipomoeae]|uniref:ATP-binding SpoIIE family protein phosphatase n=1 Tax=Streptomyces ipomoeae TaxID=103232 RepID=UPI0011468CBE|nr:SpoIIE family protein phosphatase [Streptomyces ipomoeae]TQE18912.1 GAF domain-containing protein [Streptomyces ipomoeae]
MDTRRPVSQHASGHCAYAADAAAATISPEGIVMGWSEGARRLLGHRAADVVGRTAADLLVRTEGSPAEGSVTPPFSLADLTDLADLADLADLRDSPDWTGPATLRHRDGHDVAVTLRAYPSLDGEGRVQSFVVTAAPADRPTAPATGPATSRTSDAPDAPATSRTLDTPEAAHARRLVQWAHAQSPLAMSTYTKGPHGWRRNEAASENTPGSPPEVDAVAEADFLRLVEQVAEEGRPMRHERTILGPFSSRQQAWITEMWPVRDPVTGEVCGVGTATFDSSEEHWARQRLALLNEAGTRIGSTLNVQRTAQELADLAVPRLADFVSVDLLDSVLRGQDPAPGPLDARVRLRRVAHQSTQEGVPEAAVALGALDAYPSFSPPARALATGKPLLSGFDDPDYLRWIQEDGRRMERVREFGFHSIMSTPLRARGVTLGVVLFARREGSKPFERDDLVLAEELSGRAAVGMDNARRYTRERMNALTLQRSLLPQDLPRQVAVETAYRYLPAGSGAGVGGDWFDVVPLSGTRVALVVGDVVGHGLHASAAMGRLRTAVRTLADVDLPPDELLTHLDDLVAHLTWNNEAFPDQMEMPHAGEIGATCLYAVYDPVSHVCTLASAGHPPPAVLSPDGTVSLVRLSPGPLLGVGGLPFEATEVELPEGSLLAFYTDGLVEARDHDIGLGLDRLCEALASPVPSLETTCDFILKALLPETPADDVALLLARTRTLHTDQVAAWSLPSDPAIVADARAQVSRQLALWGLQEAAYVTELVVSELVTNAIRYGAVPIGLRLIRDRTLICEVSDASSTAPHLRRARVYDEGGRGLHMVAQLTQGWGTRQTSTGKTIWAEQPLPTT